MSIKAKMKILIVEDASTMRQLIKSMLNQIGFKNLQEAEDGQRGLEMILEAQLTDEPIEFVISDWKMPKLDGIGLLENLRADEALKMLPVLLVTADAEQANVLKAVKAGANNFIVKPFSAEILKEKIAKIFQ